MKKLSLIALAFLSFAAQSFAEIKPGDLVLIKGYNRGVSVYRPAYVLLTENDSSVVQELNYPTRYGSTTYTYNRQGEVVKTFGVSLAANSDLIESTSEISRNGIAVKEGDIFKIRLSPRAHKATEARVLAVFKNGKVLAMLNEAYEAYKQNGDRVFTSGPVGLYVR